MSEPTKDGGNNWHLGSAIAGGVGGALLGYASATKEAEKIAQAYKDYYEPELRRLGFQLAYYKQAHANLLSSRVRESVERVVEAQKISYGSIVEECNKAMESFRKALAQQPVLSFVPAPKAIRDDVAANQTLRRENDILRKRIEDAYRYISQLGGTVEPINWPQYDSGDSLPWSKSPD